MKEELSPKHVKLQLLNKMRNEKAEELRKYPILCSWCLPEKTVMGYGPVPNSHGMCNECVKGVMAGEASREILK